MKKEKTSIMLAGLAIGIVASLLTLFGNPRNMGLCIACFIRDTAGAMGLHNATAVQYLRPEICGIILGSFFISVIKGEFNPKGGSSPMTRFILGFFVMIGCLMCLGCPLRMAIRMGGGDINALIALLGFGLGIYTGVLFLNRGYSLGKNHSQNKTEGFWMPAVATLLTVFVVITPSFIYSTAYGEGPAGMHSAWYISLLAGLLVGVLAQRTRLCMAGGFRDIFLFRDHRLMLGFVSVFLSVLFMNLILTAITGEQYFRLALTQQPIAHSDICWNILGMYLVGLGSALLGGCPLRQLILSGEGNADSAITVLGLVAGAGFAHNCSLASSVDGPSLNGKIAVISGIVIVLIVAAYNTKINRK